MNYVALLSNKPCLKVNRADLLKVKEILHRCFYYYKNLNLTPICTEDLKFQGRVPFEDYQFNTTYTT